MLSEYENVIDEAVLERMAKIRHTKNTIFERALAGDLQEVSLMAYGSSSYSFVNGGLAATATHIDFDGIAVVTDPSISYARFSEIVNSIYDDATVPPEHIFQAMMMHTVGIIMIKGTINGEEVNFHFLMKDTLQRLVSGIGHNRTTTLFRKTRDTFNIKKKGYLLSSGLEVELDAEATIYEEDQNYWLVRQAVSKTVTVEGEVQVVKALLADKILTSTVIWDPTTDARNASKRMWTNYVRACLFYNPDISNEQILSRIYKSFAFSTGYVSKLLRRIETEREILRRRKAHENYSEERNPLRVSLSDSVSRKNQEHVKARIPEQMQQLYLNQIETYFNLINLAGIGTCTFPEFSFDESGYILNTTVDESVSGEVYLQACSVEEAIQFYVSVILNNILRLRDKQPPGEHPQQGCLRFSLNPAPNSFRLERNNELDKWVYTEFSIPLINAETTGIPQDMYSRVKIWNMALIAVTKIRPELAPMLYEQTVAFLDEQKLIQESLYIQEHYFSFRDASTLVLPHFADRVAEYLQAHNELGINDATLIEENLKRYFLGVSMNYGKNPSSHARFNFISSQDEILLVAQHEPLVFFKLLSDLKTALQFYDGYLLFRGERIGRNEAILLSTDILNAARLTLGVVSPQIYHEVRELAFQVLFPESYEFASTNLKATFEIAEVSDLEAVVSNYTDSVRKLVEVLPHNVMVRSRARRPAGAFTHMLQKQTDIQNIDDNISIQLTLQDVSYEDGEELCRKYGDEVAKRANEIGLEFVARDDFRIVPTPHGYTGIHYYFRNKHGLSVELKWISENPRPQTMSKSEYSDWQRRHFGTARIISQEEIRRIKEESKASSEIAAGNCLTLALSYFQSEQTIIDATNLQYELSVVGDNATIFFHTAELTESYQRVLLPFLIRANDQLGLHIQWKIDEI